MWYCKTDSHHHTKLDMTGGVGLQLTYLTLSLISFSVLTSCSASVLRFIIIAHFKRNQEKISVSLFLKITTNCSFEHYTTEPGYVHYDVISAIIPPKLKKIGTIAQA